MIKIGNGGNNKRRVKRTFARLAYYKSVSGILQYGIPRQRYSSHRGVLSDAAVVVGEPFDIVLAEVFTRLDLD